MRLVEVIRRDVFSKLAGEFFSRLVFLLFIFYVGRRLAASDFGSLNLALSVTYILGVVFLDPGLNLAAIHMLVERPEYAGRIAGSVFSLKVLMFLPFMIVLGIISFVLGNRLPSFYVLFLAALSALFTVILEFLSAITNAYHRMDLEALLKIFNRVFIVLLGGIALGSGRISSVLLAMSLATFFASIFAWILLKHRLIRIIPQWHFATVKEAFRTGFPIAGTAILTTIYLKWDMLVLSYFSIGREQIGWYAGAFKIVEAFSALPGILGAGLFPMMVRLHRKGPGSLDRLLGVSTKAVLLFSIPAAAVVSVFSRNILLLVYGPKYLPGASVLAVLIWCIVPIFLYFYLVFVNIAVGQAKYNLLAGCVALGTGVVANSVLVPRIGYLGAAWSALVANTTFALLATWKVCSVFRNASLPAMLLRLATAGVSMVTAFLLTPAPVARQLVLGLLTYLIALIALGSLRSDDLSLALRLLQLRANEK